MQCRNGSKKDEEATLLDVKYTTPIFLILTAIQKGRDNCLQGEHKASSFKYIFFGLKLWDSTVIKVNKVLKS